MAFHFVNTARPACIPHSMFLVALAGIVLHTPDQPAAGLKRPPLPVVEQWTDREYVYGPDYVDEFVAQFDRDGRPMLMLQDGNFNVVALLAGADDVFFDASTNGLPAGAVLEQYVYDPYGAVRQADSFAEHAVNRVGHQGLFFDRFDGDWENASLAPGAIGLYYNRNRFYSPPALRNVGDAENPDWRIVGLGRFISADPNETALTIISALYFNANSAASTGGPFSLGNHYADGMNIYLYASANPINHRDPLGTFSYTDIGTAMFTQGLLGALLGGAVSKAMGNSFWDGALSGGIGGALGGGAGYAVSAFGASLSGLVGTLGAKAMIGGAAGFADGLGQGLYDRQGLGHAIARATMGSFVGAATGGMLHAVGGWACFEADTLVLMADGSWKPIQDICVGEYVASLHGQLSQQYGNSDHTSHCPEIKNEGLVQVHLEIDRWNGSCTSATLLATAESLTEPDVLASGTLGLHGLNSIGRIHVVGLNTLPDEGCSPTEDHRTAIGCRVVATYATNAAQTVALFVSGEDEPICLTQNHPVFSEDRNAWVGVGCLHQGERIRTLGESRYVRALIARAATAASII